MIVGEDCSGPLIDVNVYITHEQGHDLIDFRGIGQ